ncbi:MAG: membrane protein insertion efficiency factor YidD [Planctomycetes bacterium]|nr:membrane protein insertion efficiency factor YidD [Planctomycetota bacterium]
MKPVLDAVRRIALLAVELLIRGYQAVISPLLIGNCKFVPSCSDYFLQSVREWGVVRGSWIGLRRIARCHPFGPGGIDPVPRRRGA